MVQKWKAITNLKFIQISYHLCTTVYPDKCTMSVVGLEDSQRRLEVLTFWDDVYGMKSLN